MTDKTLSERIEAILTPTGRTPSEPEMQRIVVLPGHNAGQTAAVIAALKGDHGLVVDIETDFAGVELQALAMNAMLQAVIKDPEERRYQPLIEPGNRRERRAAAARGRKR